MEELAKDVAIIILLLVTGWMLKTWLTHREKMKGLDMTKQNLASSDQRLERVEQAVESIAIEVERIGEGQRYVTNLLSERSPHVPALPLKAARIDTPH